MLEGWGRLRYIVSALAAVGIALAATAILLLTRPDRAITLLIYLPGITIVDALFGVWGGVAAVLLSVAGSAATRLWFLHNAVRRPASFYATWEEEMILLAVGLFVVALMEQRRRSGARAATGARQMEALLDNLPDAVLVFDRDLRVAQINPAAHAMLDRPGETLVGESIAQLRQRFVFQRNPPDEATEPPLLEDTTRAGLATHEEGTVFDVEHHCLRHVLASATPWRNSENEIDGTLVLVTDVTALKDLQLRTLDNARHVAIAQMVSGLAHDFNHALDIIRRAVAVLELNENASAADRRKYRAMIDRAAQDGATIVRRLRDYLSSGASAMEPMDLRAAAEEAIELTRPLWRGRAEIQIRRDLAPVPLVRGSSNDLRRVLTNLIFNAVEALGADGGTITIHTGPAPRDLGHVRAFVEDNGPGVPPEAQNHLFQPYFTTKPQGMGMGLFGAQKIILAHGGTLRFESVPGRGTRFTVELPVLPELHNRQPDAQPNAA